MKNKLLKYFDYNYYILKYPDLKNLNEELAINHLFGIDGNGDGIKEGRIFCKELENYNYEKYLLSNPSLKNKSYNCTPSEACLHYLEFGIKEQKLKEHKLLKYFDYNYYISKYPDLKLLNKDSCLHHLINHGFDEQRIFCKELENYNYEKYLLSNPNLKDKSENCTPQEVCLHYLEIGLKEQKLKEEALRIKELKLKELKLKELKLNEHKLKEQKLKELKLKEEAMRINEHKLLKYFDYNYYISKYPDLKLLNKDSCLHHLINHGFDEQRIFCKELENYNYKKYLLSNPNLKDKDKNCTPSDVCLHYLEIGLKEQKLKEEALRIKELKLKEEAQKLNELKLNYTINLVGIINKKCSVSDNLYLMKKYFKNKVNLLDYNNFNNHIINNNQDYIFCIEPFELININLHRFKNKPAVLWVWEFKSLPSIFKDQEKYFNKIYTQSQFCYDVFSAHLSIPIEKIELKSMIHDYIDKIPTHVIVNTNLNKLIKTTQNKIKFGYCFDINSSLVRKNPLNLIKAFDKINNNKYVLILKYRKGDILNKFEESIYNEMNELIDNNEHIYTINEELTLLDLYKMYSYLDYYISPHAGEGFGFTIYDNMILETKIISTYYSGEKDYLKEGQFIELIHTEREIEGLKEHTIYGQMSSFKAAYVSLESIQDVINNDLYPSVIIDCQPLQHEIRGIGRYGENLVNTIIKNNKKYDIKLLVNNFISKDLLNKKITEKCEIIEFKFKNMINPDHSERNVNSNILDENKHEHELCNFINKLNPKIYINISEFDRRKVMVNIKLLRKEIKTYCILHDLIPLKLNLLKDQTDLWNINYNKQLNNLKLYKNLLSNSQYTNDDSSDIFNNLITIGSPTNNLNNNSISTLSEENLILKKFNINKNKKYIIFQSSFDEHKNFSYLFNQYLKLPSSIQNEIHLIFACNIPKYYIEKNNLYHSNLIITGYLTDNEIIILYKYSWLKIYPSKYEGFGLPVIEAWNNKLPVIVANNTSLKEIMDNSQFTFELNDSSCSNLIVKLYKNPELYNECLNHGQFVKINYTSDNINTKLMLILNNKIIKISVVLVVYNNEKWLKYIINKFNRLEKLNNKIIEFEFHIYENNSKDNTKQLIKDFMKNRKGTYLCENIDKLCFQNIDISRGKWMNFIRNKNKINHGILTSDYVWLIDSDVYILDSTCLNFIRVLQDKKIAQVSGYCLCKNNENLPSQTIKDKENHYYDSFLFSTDKYNYKDTDNTCIFDKCIRCKNHRKANNINIETIKYGGLIEVKSAFGSMCMIPTNYYNQCNWNDKHGLVETDHYSFIIDLSKFGKIIIDTNNISHKKK